jgi:hypothetical protein
MRSVLVSAFLAGAALACGSGDGVPLGGPHGGTGSSVAPTGGSTEPSSGEPPATPATPAGDVDSGTPDAGAPSDDAGATGPSGGEGGLSSADAPTWTAIYTQYLGPGTMGGCGSCHNPMTSAAGAFTWLTTEKQLGGASPELTNPNLSCLSWLGGNMPPSGPTSEPAAQAAMQAWVAAGAQNN